MTYNPPIPQILLAMQAAGQLAAPHDVGLSLEDVQAILSEAGRFAGKRIAPLNPVGDRTPSTLDESGKVITPPGWCETYSAWCEAGWNSLTGPVEYGGQGLPIALAVACTEFWNSSCMAFALCPLLTAGAIEAVSEHASADLKERYLPKLVSMASMIARPISYIWFSHGWRAPPRARAASPCSWFQKSFLTARATMCSVSRWSTSSAFSFVFVLIVAAPH